MASGPPAPPTPERDPQHVTPAEALIARYWREVWSEGRFEVAREVYAQEYLENEVPTNPDAFIEGASAWRAHFADFRADLDEIFSAGSRVVSRVTYRGTHTGDFRRVPARGSSFEVTGLDVFEFEDGRVVRHWHSADHLELFTQLGAELRPAAPASEAAGPGSAQVPAG
jgi:steroid delta-isomerase-like uncharacterized protein